MPRGRKPGDPVARFWAYVTPAPAFDCWVWAGAKDRGGYGRFKIGQRSLIAHRWGWEHMFGPIPEGLALDHLCRNTLCVNPYHLEPVTNRVNSQRRTGATPDRRACVNGHPYTEATVYLRNGTRYCRVCNRDHARAYRARMGVAS